MLEGLEISIVLKSEITIENEVFRFDSQYFKKDYLNEDKNRKKYPNKFLGDIAFITDGQHGYHEVDENSPIRHLTAKNAKNWFANDDGADRIAKWVDDNNKRSSLQIDDLILSTRGSVGFCALVDENVLPANIDQDVARIKFITDDVQPTVTLAYLNGRIGRDWMKRNETGMVQQGIALWRVRQIPIPIFSHRFQDSINGLVRTAKSKLDQSKNEYTQAENLLIQEIGLENCKPSTESVNIKSFKESFLSSGRLDPEYYQPKYEDYEDVIKNFKEGFTYIRNEFELIKNTSRKSEKQYNYIEIGDVSINDGTSTYNLIETEDLPANAKIEVEKGDILISKVRPNRGAVTIIDFDCENLIVSGAFTVLREKEESVFSNEVLKVLLRTDIYKEWLLKFNVGTQYPVIRDDDVLNLPIPKLDKSTQEEIKDKVRLSQDLKKQSELLLDHAKNAVEIAIEQKEAAAINFINTSLAKL